MKNSIYLLIMFLGIALTGCEPMDEIHEEIDARLENRAIQGTTQYTLTADDYADLELNFGNFNSIDDAAALIPGLLTEKFPVWGEGSLAQVTFNLYAPITLEEFSLTAEGYEAIGLNRNFFNGTSEIKDFLSYQFPQANLNDYVELTYRTVAVEQTYGLTNDDFDLIGETLDEVYPAPADNALQYNSFEIREDRSSYWSDEMILEALNVVMHANFTGIEGQTYEVTYRTYSGSLGSESMNVKYDGTNYVAVGASGTPYRFTTDDFDLIGAELGDEYPGPAANADQFNSFSIVSSSDNFWNDNMILEAANMVLLNNFPDATEGTQFDVTYRIYNGTGTADAMASFVLSDGEYVRYQPEISTVMETSVFARGNRSWSVPIELPEVTEEYDIYQDEFEQSNPYFSNESRAGFYIGRWLEPRFPYAEDEDFVSVKYEYSNDRIRYASFVYNEEEREWEFIPSVIEQTLQFGHEANGWVVDNTIVYTLAESDYEFIGEELIEEYPGPADSAGWFNNFDRRPGNANQWTDAMLIEAFNILLNERVAPDAEEGQKYLMTFDIYNGTNTVEQMHLIKDSGAWVPVQ